MRTRGLDRRVHVLSLAVLAATAIVQGVVFIASGSVALLADLIHGGDALTALPLGIAFAMRSRRAEGYAGLAVVAAIFISALVAGAESIRRLIDPSPPTDLWVLAAAGAIGYLGNWVAAKIRTRAGRRLESPALLADGNHARADAYVSLAVVAAAAAVAVGLPILDPIIGLLITVAILRITWASWYTVRDDVRDSAHHIAVSPRAAHQDPRAAAGATHRTRCRLAGRDSAAWLDSVLLVLPSSTPPEAGLRMLGEMRTLQ